MDKISLGIRVRVDDWTAERAIIASNTFLQLVRGKGDEVLCVVKSKWKRLNISRWILTYGEESGVGPSLKGEY